MSYICKLGRAEQGATLIEGKEQSVARAGLRCWEMPVLNGHGTGIESILPIS